MHDKNGKPIKDGDIVYVAFRIVSSSSNEDFCNINCESVEPMHPGTHKTSCTFNAKQVELPEIES